ncbi:MAG: phosphate/phosphite/phosphonate ABC transporter substrate-binding protein [Candidatus Schekmanbacteria bacterium]|nr:phosphate/phosphite/phosphonate ABC transporter substrate-binding protein [Candidatus Schekmanbacteria bacterium]
MNPTTKIIFTICAFSLSVTACSDMSLKEKSPSAEQTTTEKPLEKKPLNFCVGAVITPKEGLAYYRKLLDYIGEKLNRSVKYVDLATYKDVNEQLKRGQIDVAFVCSGPYVAGHKDFGLELIAAPQVNGEVVYYSYIIVPKDSSAKSLTDLRFRSFAFTDPASNSGKRVPDYMLSKMGETPDSFFSRYVFTSAHDRSIRMVAQKMVDGAAVDSLIWEYMNQTSPDITSQTRVLAKSDSYGIPPIVVRPGLDEDTKQEIKNVLFTMHNDIKGKEILKKMLIEKFVPAEDKNYDSIREIEE